MERLKEIDIIRTFVIILLVLYHALAPYCGGWDMPSYAQPNEGFYWGRKTGIQWDAGNFCPDFRVCICLFAPKESHFFPIITSR